MTILRLKSFAGVFEIAKVAEKESEDLQKIREKKGKKHLNTVGCRENTFTGVAKGKTPYKEAHWACKRCGKVHGGICYLKPITRLPRLLS